MSRRKRDPNGLSWHDVRTPRASWNAPLPPTIRAKGFLYPVISPEVGVLDLVAPPAPEGRMHRQPIGAYCLTERGRQRLEEQPRRPLPRRRRWVAV